MATTMGGDAGWARWAMAQQNFGWVGVGHNAIGPTNNWPAVN